MPLKLRNIEITRRIVLVASCPRGELSAASCPQRIVHAASCPVTILLYFIFNEMRKPEKYIYTYK